MASYPSDWPQISRAIRERDGNICEDCGAYSRRSNTHHIIPKSLGGSDEPWNLRTVCYPCHGMYPLHKRIRDSVDYSRLQNYRPKIRAREKELIRRMYAIKKDKNMPLEMRKSLLEEMLLQVKEGRLA